MKVREVKLYPLIGKRIISDRDEIKKVRENLQGDEYALNIINFCNVNKISGEVAFEILNLKKNYNCKLTDMDASVEETLNTHTKKATHDQEVHDNIGRIKAVEDWGIFKQLLFLNPVVLFYLFLTTVIIYVIVVALLIKYMV